MKERQCTQVLTQRNATQRNATQRNATQRNATQRNATYPHPDPRQARQRRPSAWRQGGMALSFSGAATLENAGGDGGREGRAG